MKTPEQEYRDAFNGDDDIDAVTGEEETNAVPLGAAAEGAGASSDPAVAVVITEDPEDGEGEGAEGGDSASELGHEGDPAGDDLAAGAGGGDQRLRSWEGRLKKREQELAAREAALAEREAGAGASGDVLAAKDGAKVEGDPTGAVDDGGAEAAEAAEGAAGAEAGRSDDDIITEGLQIYGPEFESFIAALLRRYVGQEAGPLVTGLESKIEGLAKLTSAGLENMHMAVLDALVDNLDEITEGEAFRGWLDGLPEEERAQAEQVVEGGTVGQVKRLIAKFAESQKQAEAPAEQTPEDIWAEDAATTVRGSSPVRLPEKAAMSEEDEYKAAWNAA